MWKALVVIADALGVNDRRFGRYRIRVSSPIRWQYVRYRDEGGPFVRTQKYSSDCGWTSFDLSAGRLDLRLYVWDKGACQTF